MMMMTIDTIKKLFRTFALIVMSLAVQTARGAFSQPEPTLPTDSWAIHRATSFSSGSGTQADPWVITSPKELAFLAYQVTNNQSINGVACKTAYYSLQQDIDLKEHIWVPIGNLSTEDGKNFKGNFEGNGHVIKNMMLQWEVTNSTQAIGLFSTILNGAVVQNLVLDNAYIYNKETTITNPTADRLVAPFAGAVQTNTKIQNIIVKNTKVEVTEAYNQNSKWMLFGGFIAKALNNSNTYNLTNIYVDVDIDITKLTVNKTSAVYASLFVPEFFSNIKDAPKNIYLEGSILASANLTLVGPVFGTNLPSASTYKNTWQISNANTYQYTTTTDGETTRTNLTTKNAGGTSVSSFDASSFNTFSSENDLLSWTGSADNPTLMKIVFPTLTKTRDESKRNNKDVVCTVSAEEIEGTISYEWKVDDVIQESKTNTLTVTATNKQKICSVHITNDGDFDYTINFTVDPLYYSIDLYADKYAGGEGTKENPYIINDDLQLAKLARDVNSSTNRSQFAGKYFKLGSDITLNQALWVPIGVVNYKSEEKYFYGKFDGDGHVVRDMNIEWYSNDSWGAWGLFSVIQGKSTTEAEFASVTNLIIDGAELYKKAEFSPSTTVKGMNIGTLAGEVWNNVEISNIIVRNSKITDNEDYYNFPSEEFRIGGVIGALGHDSEGSIVRVYNLSSDIAINVAKNNTVNRNTYCFAGIMGRCAVKSQTNALHIYPTNLYYHGSGFPTDASKKYLTADIAVQYKTAPTDNQKQTWYYLSPDHLIKKYGKQLNQTVFQSIANKYITDNSGAV